MADQLTVEEVEKAMYKLIEEGMGMKKYKATDLHKACAEIFGDDRYDKKLGKTAIRNMVNSGKLVYTYFGGSYIEIPHREGAQND